MESKSWIFRALFLWLLHLNLAQRQYWVPRDHTSNQADLMGTRDRWRMYILGEEIAVDTRLKQRQLHAIKAQFAHRISYELGIIMGQIREKYKRMNDIFKEMLDRRRKRNLFLGPGVWDSKPFHYIISMEMVKSLEMEIEKMILVMETTPKKAFENQFELLRDFMGGDEMGLTLPPAHDQHQNPPPRPRLRQGQEEPEVHRNRPGLLPKSESPLWGTFTKGGVSPSYSYRNEKDVKDFYRDKFNERNRKGNLSDNWLDQYYGFS